jgi:hypothetical protein
MEGTGVVKDRSKEEDRKRLLEAGWEWKVRGGLVVWHRPDRSGSWYSQDVAIQILEALEEEEDHRKGEQ